MATTVRVAFRAVRAAHSGLTTFRYYLHVDCTCRLATSLVGTYATEELALADNNEGYAVMRCTKSAPAPAAPTGRERRLALIAADKAARDAAAQAAPAPAAPVADAYPVGATVVYTGPETDGTPTTVHVDGWGSGYTGRVALVTDIDGQLIAASPDELAPVAARAPRKAPAAGANKAGRTAFLVELGALLEAGDPQSNGARALKRIADQAPALGPRNAAWLRAVEACAARAAAHPDHLHWAALTASTELNWANS